MFARDDHDIKQVDFVLSMEISWDIYSGRFVYCYRYVSPLNSLIQDQISGLKSSGLRASAISINIRKEIFHGEITIGLHILRLNRGC
jgi:hypothetical protein